MARPRCTRRPVKRNVEKKLPEVHGDYYNQIKIYKDTNNHYKILNDDRHWQRKQTCWSC